MRRRVREGKYWIGKTLLPRDVFIDWALEDETYQRLFALWKFSGYDRQLSPTVDRIDSNEGYDLNNIQWLTSQSNAKKSHHERKSM